MKKGRLFGLTLITTGILIVLSSFSGITGFAVFEGVGKNVGSIVGIVLVVVGGILMLVSHFHIVSHTYYMRRVNELIRYPDPPRTSATGQPIYISLWEANGILNEFNDRGYTIEHGKEASAIHHMQERHFHVEGTDFDKHLVVVPDPGDSRIKVVGREVVRGAGGDKIKNIISKVYHPMHPRMSGREKIDYTRRIEVE